MFVILRRIAEGSVFVERFFVRGLKSSLKLQPSLKLRLTGWLTRRLIGIKIQRLDKKLLTSGAAFEGQVVEVNLHII